MDFLISRNLSIFEVGDLETVAKEQAVSSGGKLDSLIKYSFNDAIYEVVVRLEITEQANIIKINKEMFNKCTKFFSIKRPSMALYFKE